MWTRMILTGEDGNGKQLTKDQIKKIRNALSAQTSRDNKKSELGWLKEKVERYGDFIDILVDILERRVPENYL